MLKPLKQHIIDVSSFRLSKSLYSLLVLFNCTDDFDSLYKSFGSQNLRDRFLTHELSVFHFVFFVSRGRPKLRCEDGVTEDARELGERNWRNAARNRDSWQKLLKKALAQKGLLHQ